MQKIQTIVWDWNGTLLDDVELCRHTINRLLVKRGLKRLDLEQYRRVFQNITARPDLIWKRSPLRCWRTNIWRIISPAASSVHCRRGHSRC